MTYKQAVTEFELSYCSECPPAIENNVCYRDECEIYIAIKAIEKQIPKKPLVKHYEDTGEKPYIKITCPNGCRIQLNPVTDRHMSYEHCFCPNCGQAIDWSEG